ncbi:DNA polymerase III subunit gamma/tau [Leuconostoc mesenteroides]|uniref:DNA polymerase III subunit gamma/tau n=2 Tax=Leuconostoc mesenteroides TaxID=1245 RepID=UPI000A06CADE|nr:DNA polymerase III subunit gamma/tau [Leuconostoc mesenteroides]ORI48052.1 DNA polymerase III subunit gamma/tau [Leuconostoc mesenteroides subsp. cremoris]ORI49570.1 DNA polymerase III subunit gamma/tau [Leuconostoc mesenteroides subsp. cremoris]ORI50826.1 DNA polymerase III subunit gamma/tau [Leuconostoc mesenteroides subsp. cremoris]ORI56819.1 DNA polymerase III subunit gamma/tau [Leuconostoc mesenteroides subsp. cremoris]ORI59618.1 DNA polymerase III subunit gamma/tau [Leuconostoc mesent
MKLAYQALYRVYRPRSFDDMVGQKIITQTLKNAIATQQTGHAYLFSGPRGTGKTSAAKIFAREVNGIAPETDDSQIPDIIEIDAASNNGVDEIRNIRDGANYAPIESEYKIYIIDEVHMLSSGAFNALLKTLEEPPANVKFILATTEPQKIPATILSRTQRFEFKRIDNDTIQARMAEILQKEGVSFDDDALHIIANVAEGGMRDALSILDQVLAFGADHVTLENALQVTGSTTASQLVTYLQQVSNYDTESALQTLHDILLEGKDAVRFVADLLGVLRDVMLAEVAPNLIKTTAPLADLKALTIKLGTSRIQQMMVTLDDIQKQLLQTMQSDVYLELLTVKLSMPEPEQTVPAKQSSNVIKEKPQNIDDIVKASKNTEVHEEQVVEPAIEKTPVEVPDVENAEYEDFLVRTGQNAVFAVLIAAKRDALARVKNAWSDLLRQFNVTQQAMLTIAEPVAASEQAVVLAFDYPVLLEQALHDATLQNNLVQQLQSQNLPSELVFISQDEWTSDRASYVNKLKTGETPQIQLEDVPRVKAANLSAIPTKTPQESSNKELKIVSEAKELFGEDLVNIVD